MHTAAIILGLIGVLVPFLLVGLRRYALLPAATARGNRLRPRRSPVAHYAKWPPGNGTICCCSPHSSFSFWAEA